MMTAQLKQERLVDYLEAGKPWLSKEEVGRIDEAGRAHQRA